MTRHAETLPFRMTPQRAAILEVIRHANDHPTALEVYERVQGRLPGIGVATVYRALDLFVEHRMVRALQIGDTPVTRYDKGIEHHEHVRCRRCGAVADVETLIDRAALERARQSSGFRVDGYELILSGHCPDCG